ncbi:MAG: hypothetical protein ABIG87_03185 [Patescibacteria group bacterium]
MKKQKEKILPGIKLKYYNKGEDGKDPTNPDMVCCFCGEKNIAIGSIMDAYSDNPKFVCEDCAIIRYQKEHNLKTKAAAAARRRRIFDVGYLFSEMITDKYLKEKGLKTIDDLEYEDMEKIMEIGKEAYNGLFSKAEKTKLEETEDSEKIEEKLKEKLEFVKF